MLLVIYNNPCGRSPTKARTAALVSQLPAVTAVNLGSPLRPAIQQPAEVPPLAAWI